MGTPSRLCLFDVAAGQVFSIHDREVFTAADGSQLFFTNIAHGTINANGVLTVFVRNSRTSTADSSVVWRTADAMVTEGAQRGRFHNRGRCVRNSV